MFISYEVERLSRASTVLEMCVFYIPLTRIPKQMDAGKVGESAQHEDPEEQHRVLAQFGHGCAIHARFIKDYINDLAQEQRNRHGDS